MSERHSFQMGSTRVDYTVVRSPYRKKTVSLIWEPTKGLLIKAPLETDIGTLEGIAKKRVDWLVQHQQAQTTSRPKEWVSGEAIQYLGRNYRLRIRQGEPDCRLKSGWLEVTRNEGSIARLIESWYRKQAQARIPKRVAHYAARLNLEYGEILIRAQDKRWASCDPKGNLRFNWRILMAPMSLVDYVVAHELCHLVHPNHSEAFWNLLWTVMPDYTQRREQLKRWGSQYIL